MAQAQVNTTPARKTGTIHLNKGVAAKKTRKPRTHRVVKPGTSDEHDVNPPRMNESVWVTALSGAEGFHRDALQLELAVGLSVFSVKADAVKVGLDAKKALKEIYSKAGYACATPQGEDYKTVSRRINVAADLYQWIGGRQTIVDWVEDAPPREQVKVIMEHVKGYQFDSINDVLAKMGKPVTVKRPRVAAAPAPEPSEADQQVAEQASAMLALRDLTSKLKLPEGRVFQHGAMTVAVPVEASYEDVMSIVGDLSVFAATHLRPQAPAANAEPPVVVSPVSVPQPAMAA